MNKMISFVNKANNRKRMILMFSIMAVVLYYVVTILFFGASYLVGYLSGTYKEKQITISDFEAVNIEVSDSKTIINETDDGQLILNQPVRNIYIKATFSYDPGEFNSFYNKNVDYAWNIKKMVHAKMIDGYYVFEYPLGVEQVRIDTGIFPSITVTFDEIILNKPTLKSITNLSNGTLFNVFTLPLFLYFLIYTFMEFCIAIFGFKSKTEI